MTGPDRVYHDDGGVSVIFRSPEPFSALHTAEAWLRARGFSYGRWQAREPAGILFGDFDIQKWRNLRPIEREALHGAMTGDGRQGPIEVRIYAAAPRGLGEAIVAAPVRRPPAPSTLGLVDFVAFAVIAALLGPVIYVGSRPVFAPRQVEAGKYPMQAGPVWHLGRRTEARR